jgi:hypothetical protein
MTIETYTKLIPKLEHFSSDLLSVGIHHFQ